MKIRVWKSKRDITQNSQKRIFTKMVMFIKILEVMKHLQFTLLIWENSLKKIHPMGKEPFGDVIKYNKENQIINKTSIVVVIKLQIFTRRSYL